MSRAPSRIGLCDFCGTPRTEVVMLFRSKRGGMPPALCDGCIEQLANAMTEARQPTIASPPKGPRMVGGDRYAP